VVTKHVYCLFYTGAELTKIAH